ncbi:MAG: cell division protein FtsA [Prevotellaceae bacterium]|jgi:cell division protein FtsA|nr:cell division protein FtsA [Prevotellaceae bacterium]
MSEYVAAIDLGTTKVVTLVAKKTESGRYNILAHSEAPSSGVHRGQVENIQEVVNAVKPTIEEVRRKSGINFTDVFVGIAGQHIRCIESRGDLQREDYDLEISAKEVKRLEDSMYNIRMEPGEEILHVIPQSYNVDDSLGVNNPVGRLGQRLSANFHIIIGKTLSAQHTQRCIDRVGLSLNRLVLEPLASAKAVLTEDEKEVGVAMVDMGGGTTDLVVYYDKVVRHTAVIPFGGNVITADIKHGCGVLARQAEQMKVQYGSCLASMAPQNKIITIPGISGRESREISFKTLASIIEARLEEIIGAVMFEIERSGFMDKLSAGIVFTGGGAMFSDMPQFIRLKTGFDVRIAKPQYLTPECSPDIFRETYSTAVGLIMTGFEYIEEDEIRYIEYKDTESVVVEMDPNPNLDHTAEVRSPKPRSLKDIISSFFTDREDGV